MCFSASASFGAGIILSAVGAASIKNVESRSQTFFASIPLLFAAQQIVEGFVWLSMTNENYAGLKPITTYIYLFIAQVLWPLWIPFSILTIEPEEKHWRSQKIFLGTGIGITLVTGFCLVTYDVNVTIAQHHINYEADIPHFLKRFGGIPYFLATVFPLFFSSIKKMWWIGVGIILSYIVSALFFKQYMVSIWCYFAAIISIFILIVVVELNKAKVSSPTTKIV